MTQYIVKFSKWFVSGPLNGLMYDSQLTFGDLDSATRYVAFLHGHVEKPVKSLSVSDYTCHLARIETKQGVSK